MFLGALGQISVYYQQKYETGSEKITRMHDHNIKKVLGQTEVMTLSLGAIIGWGWIVLSGGIILDAGSLGAIIAFVLSALVFTTIGLTYAELAAAMPQLGGEHVYSMRAFGKTISFICTWSLTLTYVSVVALQAAAFPVAMEYFFPDLRFGYLWTFAGYEVYASYVLIGVITSLIILGINLRGIRLSAKVQNIAVGAILLLGIVFAIGSFGQNGQTAHLEPLFRDHIRGIFSVMVIIPFLMVGFDVIPQTAEEIKLPPRKMVRLMMWSIYIAIAWYILVVAALAFALPSDQIDRDGFAVADAAIAAWNKPWMGNMVIACGIAGIITSWNAFMIGGSRAMLAMAASGMLPERLNVIHPRYGSPYKTLAIITGVAIISALMGRKAMIFFVNAGSFSLLIAYGIVAASFLALRRKEPDMPRPFRVKAGRLVGSLAMVCSLALALLFLPGMPAALIPTEWIIVGIWMALGIVLYRKSRPIS